MTKAEKIRLAQLLAARLNLSNAQAIEAYDVISNFGDEPDSLPAPDWAAPAPLADWEMDLLYPRD